MSDVFRAAFRRSSISLSDTSFFDIPKRQQARHHLFDDYDDIVTKTFEAWNFFANDPDRIASITSRTSRRAVTSKVTRSNRRTDGAKHRRNKGTTILIDDTHR